MMTWKEAFLTALFLTALIYFAHTISALIDILVRMIL